jgi:hypothetical protein
MHSAPLVEAQNPATFSTIGPVPSKLAVYISPSAIPNDGGSHNVVFVQLQDVAGNPCPAPADGVGISLSSSNTTVGTVNSAVTIAAGTHFIRTWFKSTTTVGTTLVTATASGYASGSAAITTVVPSNSPTKLYIPSAVRKLPADDAINDYVVSVQLQDATGNPATAPSPVNVSLSSSNTFVGTVTPSSINITAGKTYVQVSFDTTYTPGSATITATNPGYTPASAVWSTFAAVPTKLVVYAAPPSVPAVATTYSNTIFVQLQDASGNPARASIDINVALTSSNGTVGSVPSPRTIAAGSTFATTNFIATYTPGSTEITATAADLTPGSVTMKTVAPTPTKLVVYGGPPLPANNAWQYTPVVQLQDAAGNPARAPAGGVSVALASSNALVGTVTTPLTISAGDTYAHISFKPTLLAGTTTINSTAFGYTAGSDTITTVTPAGSASKLAVYTVPSKVPADDVDNSYPLIVQLQNATGYPVNAPTGGIGIGLSSSNPSVCAVHAAVSISAGATYARTYFTATYTPGSATVSAVSSGYTSGSGVVTTTGATPSQLAVYASLPKVPADGGYYSPIIVVQLQDSDGNPARAPTGGVGLSLWSSNPQVATLPYPYAQISAGSTYTTNGFYSTYVPGLTYISAAVSQLLSMLSLSVTPKTVTVGGSLTISIQLWPKISTQVDMYYRVGAGPWTLVPLTIVTNSTGGYSVKVSYSSIPVGTYDLVVVWKGSSTYRGAVSEIRTFTRA